MKYTEDQIRVHAEAMLKQLDVNEYHPCAAADKLTGITLDCDECPYGGCWNRTPEEKRSSIIEWLFEHSDNPCKVSSKYTEDQIRRRALYAVAHPYQNCREIDKHTGIALLDLDSDNWCCNCPHPCNGFGYEEEDTASAKAAAQWLKEHPAKPESKYIIERPEGMPSWVQMGVKCKFSGSLSEHIGFLAGYDASGSGGLYYLAENGIWYCSAEPISVEGGRPKDDEMVACWGVGLDGRYIVRPYKMGLYATDEWEHVTSYHGQLDSHIEALKDEVVYK